MVWHKAVGKKCDFVSEIVQAQKLQDLFFFGRGGINIGKLLIKRIFIFWDEILFEVGKEDGVVLLVLKDSPFFYTAIIYMVVAIAGILLNSISGGHVLLILVERDTPYKAWPYRQEYPSALLLPV